MYVYIGPFSPWVFRFMGIAMHSIDTLYILALSIGYVLNKAVSNPTK